MYNKCKDVFKAFLVENACFDGEFEIPLIRASDKLPQSLITFSKANKCNDYSNWICFYEHDERDNRIWHNPKRYLNILKRFDGVISPDFSVYRDMPLAMQIFNIYKGHAIAHWLNVNGIDVIPNVRWGDDRTFDIACAGIEKYKTIAVGTHGCIQANEDRNWFKKGLRYIVDKLEPTTILVYGRVPKDIFEYPINKGIRIVAIESEFSKTHKKEASDGLGK